MSNGIFAKRIEIELDAVGDKSRQFANYQVDFGYPAGLCLASFGQSNIDYVFGDSKFVHLAPQNKLPYCRRLCPLISMHLNASPFNPVNVIACLAVILTGPSSSVLLVWALGNFS